MYVRMYVCMYVCTCMYVCMYASVYVYIRADKRASSRAEMPFPWYQPAHTFVDVAKKKMEERQTFRLPSIPRETKISCFCWAKSWQQILKRFYTGSMSKGGPGSQRRSLPFCRNPFKKKKKAWLSFASIFGSIQYLRLFWSDCSHWKGYLLTMQLNWDKKNYFISFWSANAVSLEVQGLLSSNTKTSTKNNTTQIQLQKKTYAAVVRQSY